MGILEYDERMRAIFELTKWLPPPRRNNEEYHKSEWFTSNINYEEDTIQREIKNLLPTLMKEYIEEKIDNGYWNIPTKEWIDLLGNLDSRNDRRHTACESQKPAANNNKAVNPEGYDARRKSSPRVTHKKSKTNTGKGKEKNTANHS